MTVLAPSFLRIELLSDTTFSRGESSAVADIEVERDRWGVPYIGGRTVRGLLRDSWLSMQDHFPQLHQAARRVLGDSFALDDTCRLRIGDAVLPSRMLSVVRAAAQRSRNALPAMAVLDGFSTLRYQTAEDRETGAPDETTLRSSRVVLRGFAFDAPLLWLDGYLPCQQDVQLLALCALATRHGGLLRNRGRGHIRITLVGSLNYTRECVEKLKKQLIQDDKQEGTP